MATVWCLLCVIYLTVALSKKYEQTNNENNCDSEWERQVNYDADADRIYYIACVEEEWNYCPSGKNLVSGLDIIPGSNEAMWCLGNGVDRIGPKYVKALYREYTNNCFTEQKQRSSRDEHLGALGPNIRALTGEKIKIFYKNLCSITTSLHVHGLQYDKTSEGAPYDDQSLEGDNISPNGQWIHLFHSRKTNVDKGTSSKMWIYHSHIDEPADVSSGLFGAIIVTKKGKETSATNLMPKDIDREFLDILQWSLFIVTRGLPNKFKPKIKIPDTFKNDISDPVGPGQFVIDRYVAYCDAQNKNSGAGIAASEEIIEYTLGSVTSGVFDINLAFNKTSKKIDNLQFVCLSSGLAFSKVYKKLVLNQLSSLDDTNMAILMTLFETNYDIKIYRTSSCFSSCS
eukprot:403074_1